MRVATWNVRHSAKAKTLSAAKVAAIAELQANVVVLTECALGSYAEETKSLLKGIGLEHAEVSRCDGEHNQILIAATTPIVYGYLEPTAPDPFPCNVLHVRTKMPEIDILGLRLPSGETWGAKKRRAAWDWILTAAGELSNVPAAILGDFNTSPSSKPRNGGEHFHRLLSLGWDRTPPIGTVTCGDRSEIDHIFSNRLLIATSPKCTWIKGDIKFGAKSGGLSDHAVISVDLETKESATQLPKQ